ncbi:hypothetical protein AOR_1_674054 [Paecilomyces variotii No. 5]|uniref:P-loop containing nucleoside triphosphate hydrolase protein n=1 Tax=Byssochlamys spectabilis (strain No. 5 / NBRC 109023) TaxID=1356009 RepID=V5FNJ6_BYSSN|nr:hypothetical protein AOR_1_674054 [Paecilomyces variotii No. 5]
MGSIGNSTDPTQPALSESANESRDSIFSEDVVRYHCSLLGSSDELHEVEEDSIAPVVRSCVFAKKSNCEETPNATQFGLLGGLRSKLPEQMAAPTDDHRIFFNVSTPSSTFICGSQGSGKSHTLSCILENCLISSKAGRLSNPLTGVVFHYDTFISDSLGSPCEAAFLSSHPDVEVRVLCSPTNIRTIQVGNLPFNIEVSPLQIDQKHLNTKRMLDLMAVGQDNGPIPLYMHTIKRILREMRMSQQQSRTGFDYQDFKQRITFSGLNRSQIAPLTQRLDTLESFMPKAQTMYTRKGSPHGSDWKPKARRLTIVDLSCPCISPETACSLFNVCLGIFLEQDSEIGRVVALDESHKYMNSSIEAQEFTETLLSAVRLQRHLGARMIISTQEPTISPALLNLCSLVQQITLLSPRKNQTEAKAASSLYLTKLLNFESEKRFFLVPVLSLGSLVAMGVTYRSNDWEMVICASKCVTG